MVGRASETQLLVDRAYLQCESISQSEKSDAHLSLGSSSLKNNWRSPIAAIDVITTSLI